MGKLTTIYGPMFAGKTSEIITRCNEANTNGKTVLIVKYGDDNRYCESCKIISHNGAVISNNDNDIIIKKANNIENIFSIIHNIGQLDLLIIDEAQFFKYIYKCIAQIIQHEKYQHLDIIIAGLDLDAKGNIFNEGFNTLIAISDEVIYKLAQCYICNKSAPYTIRLDHDSNSKQVQIGGADIYQPVCNEHHDM